MKYQIKSQSASDFFYSVFASSLRKLCFREKKMFRDIIVRVLKIV